jgi:hypothetical protein
MVMPAASAAGMSRDGARLTPCFAAIALSALILRDYSMMRRSRFRPLARMTRNRWHVARNHPADGGPYAAMPMFPEQF